MSLYIKHVHEQWIFYANHVLLSLLAKGGKWRDKAKAGLRARENFLVKGKANTYDKSRNFESADR
jgi:hypothetical protein